MKDKDKNKTTCDMCYRGIEDLHSSGCLVTAVAGMKFYVCEKCIRDMERMKDLRVIEGGKAKAPKETKNNRKLVRVK